MSIMLDEVESVAKRLLWKQLRMGWRRRLCGI